LALQRSSFCPGDSPLSEVVALQVRRKSLFDQLEDLNVNDCTTKAKELWDYENPKEEEKGDKGEDKV
jgi:hypothetical protein